MSLLLETKKPILRDSLLIVLMLAAVCFVWLQPVTKDLSADTLQLESMIPENLPMTQPVWKSVTHDVSDFQGRWQSINELLIRTYFKRNKDSVDFILEYSSDLRRNFSFHFPEDCHRSGGNEVDFFEPLEVPLDDGRIFKTKILFIKGVRGSVEEHDKLVAYWLVMDKKAYHKIFWIKLDQMLSGLLKKAKSGFLVRIDFRDRMVYSDERIAEGKQIITQYIQELYRSLPVATKERIFGRIY